MFTYENVPDWKVNRFFFFFFFPKRFKIQSNIKADFSFAVFDPYDCPTDTSQLKGMTSQFKGQFNAAFFYSEMWVVKSGKHLIMIGWENINVTFVWPALLMRKYDLQCNFNFLCILHNQTGINHIT